MGPNRTHGQSRQPHPSQHQKNSLVAPCEKALAVAAFSSLQKRRKALRQASKRHRGAPDLLDRGR
jgi:hypothetical protein